jgi:TonB family protein
MRLAYAAVLPVLAGTMFLCNPVRAQVQNPTVPPYGIIVVDDLVAAPDSVGQSVPFSEVDQAPTFQGGNANEFGRWVAQHLTYPEAAKEAGIMGHVMLQFKICSDGEVREVKVLRSAGNDLLDAEAVRVLSASPKWEPGYVDGQPVNVTFQFPVVFQLRDRAQVRNDTTVRQVTSYPVGDGKGVVSAIRIAGPDGAEPLVILDGVKQAEGRKAMEKIDPSTIESIEVLKDEAATAKYGPEAKYGVVLITTKK